MNRIRNGKKSISIVVPCYNEEEVLSELISRLTKSALSWNMDWKVICIDDGSTDNTWEILMKQVKKDHHWSAISLSRNFGHQIAISCGLGYAKGNAVIIMDADLQDPPEEFYRYIKKWKQGYDVVYAIRQKRKEHLVKRLSYWLFYRIIAQLVNFDLPLDSGDFSLMDKRVVEVLNRMPERNRFVRGLRAWSGFKQIGVEYERDSRFAGKSKYTLPKMLRLAFDGIISFSPIPLTIASYLGIIISIVAFLGALFTLIQHIFTRYFVEIGLGQLPGFATTVIAILFLGGIQLTFLGIIGSYLSRIYDEVKGRPLWIIKETTGI